MTVASLLIYQVAGLDSLLTGCQPRLWNLFPVVYSKDTSYWLSSAIQ